MALRRASKSLSALSNKTMQIEILEEAIEIAREKKLLSRGSSSDEGKK